MKRIAQALSAGVLLLSQAASAADTATLTVKVLNISDKGGDLRIGVYDQATFAVRGSKPVTGEVVPAKAGTMSFTFNLKPGEYGVKVLQDLNRNGKLDMSMMGMMPAEPFGLSNDARPTMSGPPWDDAKIALKPGAATITITLH
ncbi:MAG TPA: DUF2141 domain-containing protein [Rhizomicrobium sp.]|nr:DUF2141 domain-containing protein [Rhizomicrobium sp.]